MCAITVLGSGLVGTALAHKLAAAGNDVVIGSRDPVAAARIWTEPPVRYREVREAIRHGQVVINATPGDSSLARLTALEDELGGKVLIDLANATTTTADGMMSGLCYPGSSLAEELQKALPGTFVIKTLNTMLLAVMTNPYILASPPCAFISGNDAQAKNTTQRLLGDLGWPSAWIVDLGDIETARATEGLILLLPSLLWHFGDKPFAMAIAR